MSARTLAVGMDARLDNVYTVRVNFRYDPSDPYAVVLDVCTTPHTPPNRTVGNNWVTWTFSRDLLAEGLLSPAGEGDVRVYLDADDTAVWVELDSPTGHAALMFAKADIEKVLERTETLVPPGTETTLVDWDREWARLAGGSDTPWWGELR